MSNLEAVSGYLLLALATVSAAMTLNAVRPFRQTLLLVPSMIWSWFALGMLGQTLVVQVILAAVLIWLGALGTSFGWVALVVLAGSWAVTMSVIVTSRKAGAAVDAALRGAGVTRIDAPVATWRKILVFPFKGRSVTVQRGIPYRRVAGMTIKLDVYSDRSDHTGRPIFVYVHGGGWVVGGKREQGLPILHHLARHGWLCVSVNYRLSPIAGWPDQLIDVKYALSWIRTHADEYGGDPSFVAVGGGSAGGHLAALVGLTGNQTRYQPGFESADTMPQVVVPIYGITDVTNRLGVQNPDFVPMLMEPLVIKAYLEDEPEKFFAASPIDQIHPDAPPFVISQGDRDTMAPVEEARAFVHKLAATSKRRVVYFEFPGAQHIFDLGYSYQSGEMIEGVHSVLEDEYRRHRKNGNGV